MIDLADGHMIMIDIPEPNGLLIAHNVVCDANMTRTMIECLSSRRQIASTINQQTIVDNQPINRETLRHIIDQLINCIVEIDILPDVDVALYSENTH